MVFFLRSIRWLTSATEYMAAAVLVLMMLHVVADVIGRNFLNSPAPATTELVAFYYMIAVVFLPLAFVELRDRSIYVDLFYNFFSPALQRVAHAFGSALGIIFFGSLALNSWADAVDAYEKGEMVDGLFVVMVWPGRFILPLAFGLAVVVLIVRLIGEIYTGRNPFNGSASYEDGSMTEGER